MRIDLRDALQTSVTTESRGALLHWSAFSAVVVAVAAGITGAVRFTGARWVPHFKLVLHAAAGSAHPRSSPVRLPSARTPHGAGRIPLGPVVLWVIAGLAAIGIALLVWRWWLGRPARAATDRRSLPVEATRQIPVEPEPEEPDTAALLTGIELALQMLDEQRVPADAIVQAWLGLQETAEESGIVRAPAETPTEFTSRILSGAFADDRALRTLLRLYLRTRFGDHPVTVDDVAAVRQALYELVQTWSATRSLGGAGAS